jgi:hypothetical protein
MSSTISTASVNAYAPSTVGGLLTTVKYFPALGNNAVPATLPIPSSALGQQMLIRASGNIFVHGTSPTLNFILASTATPLSFSGNTTLATIASPVALTTATYYPFALEIKAQGDTTSGIIQLYGATFVCNGVSSTVTLTQALTGESFGSGNAANLVFGVTFGVSDALNAANLMEFELEG